MRAVRVRYVSSGEAAEHEVGDLAHRRVVAQSEIRWPRGQLVTVGGPRQKLGLLCGTALTTARTSCSVTKRLMSRHLGLAASVRRSVVVFLTSDQSRWVTWQVVLARTQDFRDMCPFLSPCLKQVQLFRLGRREAFML